VLAPTVPHRYTCPCGGIVIEVVGPSWLAWDLLCERAAVHGRTCARAGEPWQLEVQDDDAADAT
jgi:hypothetical protein